MTKTMLTLAIAATLALTGCKKDTGSGGGDATADAAMPTGLLGEATGKAQAAAAEAALPQPDKTRPLASYRKLANGTDALFLYQAASSLPPDYEKLAQAYSSEFRETSDSFRKQELLAALKPQMEQLVGQAKASPYAYITLKYNNNLEAYDFQRKGFPVFSFGENTQQERVGDYSSGKTLNWVNRSQVAFAPVADETAARAIESMRTNGKYNNPPLLNVYFFAQSANLNSDEINAVVTGVQIIDKSGRVLAEYSPDGSVPAQTPQPEPDIRTSEDAADAAASAAGASL